MIPYKLGLPSSIANRAIMVYFAVLCGVSLLYPAYSLTWYWWLFGIVGVVGFFYFGRTLSSQWAFCPTKQFERRIFVTTWIIRAIYVVIAYYFFLSETGKPHEFNVGDAEFYCDAGKYGASLIRQGDFLHLYQHLNEYCNGKLMFSDSGAPIFWSFIYVLTNDSILLGRIVQCLFSAGMCVLMYRLATRNFGEECGRLTAIFCMLFPNFFFYCATNLKETFMLFLVVLFAERADFLMRSKKMTFGNVFLIISVAFALCAFRTALGGVVVLSLFVTLILSSAKMVSWGKRILISLIALAFVALMFNNEIEQEIQTLTQTDLLKHQQAANEDRTKRKDGAGNIFAKYATATIMAPLIFTVPFPTMVEVPTTEVQIMCHGGNYVKNVTSFFTILAMFSLLLAGEWRKHVLPICIVCGYLLVLVMSSFAHSERFHEPSIPLELMFAAYMITHFKDKKRYERWFMYWMILVLVAGFCWNWIKLSGRGYV